MPAMWVLTCVTPVGSAAVQADPFQCEMPPRYARKSTAQTSFAVAPHTALYPWTPGAVTVLHAVPFQWLRVLLLVATSLPTAQTSFELLPQTARNSWLPVPGTIVHDVPFQ